MTIIVTDSHCWEYMSVYYKYEVKDLRSHYFQVHCLKFIFISNGTNKERNKQISVIYVYLWSYWTISKKFIQGHNYWSPDSVRDPVYEMMIFYYECVDSSTPGGKGRRETKLSMLVINATDSVLGWGLVWRQIPRAMNRAQEKRTLLSRGTEAVLSRVSSCMTA